MIVTAEDLLAEKGSEIVSVTPNSTLFEALKVMSERKLGAILVKDDGRFVGIWTERDLVRDTIRDGFDVKVATIRDHMSSPVVTTPHDTALYSLMDQILGLHLRHILIERDGKPIGVLSARDVMKETLRLRVAQLNELDQIVKLRYYDQWKWNRKQSSK
jgi:CBS domain-containing protein